MHLNPYRKTMTAALLILMATLPMAAQGRRDGNASSIIMSSPSFSTVAGSVISTDLQYGEGYPNFELQTIEGATYLVFVGPLRYLDDNNFELSVGDKISATIFPDAQNNDAYVAAVLTNLESGQSLILRDASGRPLWTGRGSSGHSGFGGGNSSSVAAKRSLDRSSQRLSSLRAGATSIDLSTLAVYAGIVTKVNVAAGVTHPTLEVELASGAPAVFCLGPYRYLQQIGFNIAEGASVAIKAADCALDPGEFAAFQITVGSITYSFRAEDGTPLWYSGRRP